MLPRRRAMGAGLIGAAVVAGGLAAAVAYADAGGWQGRAQPPAYQERIFPPWSHGANDPAGPKGLQFTVPEVDDLADFHGDPFKAKLVLYVGGNYYFAMAPLVAAFEREHPSLQGRIYSETLPPGILLRQIRADGTITVGNMTWTARPDVYAAGKRKVLALIARGILRGPAISYATNDLAIMIPRGNPGHIRNLRDLARPGVRVVMPNPAWEGVARQIQLSLVKAGGPSLEKMVYKTKVALGQTILTHVHHRQTPLFLMQGLAQAGVTWKSEAIFQQQAGHPISYVPIAARCNTTAIYAGGVLRHAPHPKAAREWLAFLESPPAQAIFAHYGFHPVGGQTTPRPAPPPRGSGDSPAASTVPAESLRHFTPPPDSRIPHNAFGGMVRLGENIFTHTQTYAKKYVGDGLNCVNCHLDRGRRAGAAPLWAAYVAYPRYQAKYHGVVTFQKRLQGCFRFSMNGTPPPANGRILTALVAYSCWLARGAPVGAAMPGRGYPKLLRPPLPPGAARGARVFTVNCAACHGAHGQGLLVNGAYQFPPLWGPESFNQGAGMYKVRLAAAFIKANMPLNKPGSLTNQQAWDVAAFVDSHPRPPRPRPSVKSRH